MGHMEKPEFPFDSQSKTVPEDDGLTLTGERARAMLDRLEEDREEAKRRRRAGRPKGVLDDRLVGGLRNCTILQLGNAKKLCDRLIARQLKPPLDRDCGARYTMRVQASVAVKNERYRLEFDRSSLKEPKICCDVSYVVMIHEDPRLNWFAGLHRNIKSRGRRIGSSPEEVGKIQKLAQSLRKNSITLGSSSHLFLILRLPPPGSQAARALAFMARSVSA